MLFQTSSLFLALAVMSNACNNCYGPKDGAAHVRNVRRMQPGAEPATTQPKAPLSWGELNFLHTTDTHGWLEGHIKEQNYGADWGDFVSFTKSMKQKASKLGVDLLVVDTGDLHDGNGLSDASIPNGVLTNPIFENIDYDLLTIGNHELYVTEIAYETSNHFAKIYGDKYLTSNVQILNPKTGQFDYIGAKFRYFITEQGLRVMAFGVLYDFTGNSNVSKVITAADMVKEPWFLDAVKYPQEIDLFVVLGHNPPRPTVSTSSFGLLHSTIRGLRPNIPIQAFGGHTHVRDFVVYDEMATGMESGRYCETLGFLSISGINSNSSKANVKPKGVPNPTQRAIKLSSGTNSTGSNNGTMPSTATSTGSSIAPSGTASGPSPSGTGTSGLVYFRRYLDWNRLTFAYHAGGSQDNTFDTPIGLNVTGDITVDRKGLNLTTLYGCAPETWCQSCKKFGENGNIFGLLTTALTSVVINQSRAEIPRIILINTGSVRFDLVKGPFTYDDSFIVSPFTDGFQFIPSVPYTTASKVLPILNAGPFEKNKKRDTNLSFNFPQRPDACVEGMNGSQDDSHLYRRSTDMTRGLHRRSQTLTPGYVTHDDFGDDGDDTPHSAIPSYPQPNNVQANASFPTDGSLPGAVDLIFLDFIGSEYVIPALTQLGANYTARDISYYLPETFTTNSYLPAYAKKAWQANVPNCPVGEGVGFPSS